MSIVKPMCGRFTYLFKWKQLLRLLELTSWPDVELVPRFNVAPMQLAPIVRVDDSGVRVGAMLRWGLVPSWADDPAIGGRLINARGETIAEKPAFRTAFARRRCLVPISGFYEWKSSELPKAPKQPYWIGRADREPFMLAGVWEHWRRDDQVVDSFTIITTTPNPLMSGLHDRMPVIIEPTNHAAWLDPLNTDSAGLTAMLRPAETAGFEAYPVSTRVNSPKNDDPSLVEPVDPQPQGLFGQ